MKHIYSDQLVAYLFDEVEPNLKANIKKELAVNSALTKEIDELKESLRLIENSKPLVPSQKIVDSIIEQSETSELILAD